ncbi:putative MFS family arabinose efflux permease [Stackebrandtia endophytica]|uniref:Putative MFS family arabinose efflux permease n=1 Tax=Stackebrandtia endophytica TaxID=1496996 RepID=A0A543AZB3_9ACTN|nr:MFS transporter [Stackebrandtia endophytica]TQL77860.1 putative MFS family arabinose efflux permease [Stackebrandtia endophytica]
MSTPMAGHAKSASTAHPASTGAVVVLVTTALFVLTQLYAAIPLIGPVGQDLGGDVTFALSTAFSCSYAVGFLVWGPLADQYGRRRILLIGLAALTVATFGAATASSVPVLAALRGMQGFAAASFAPVALAYLVEATPPRRRAVAIGAMSTAFLVAGILGQVLASAIALTLDWPWVFALCGIVLAVCLTAVALLVLEPPRPAVTQGLGDRFVSLVRVAAMPRVLLLAAAHVTLLLGFVAMYTGLGPHLGTLGLDASQVIWLRLVGLPGMFASLAVGPLSRRLGTGVVARLGFTIAAVGLVAEALLSSSLIGVAVASLGYVIGVAFAVPAMITLFGEAAAPHRATGMALNGFVLFIGASIGPLAAGLPVAFLTLLWGLAALAVAAVIALTVFTRITGRQEAEA